MHGFIVAMKQLSLRFPEDRIGFSGSKVIARAGIVENSISTTIFLLTERHQDALLAIVCLSMDMAEV